MQTKDDLLMLWKLNLKDGTQLNIRPITANDIELEQQFFNSLSEESKHDRFLGGVSELSIQALTDLCNIDYSHNMAFVAVTKDDSNEKIVGVVRYAEDNKGDKKAEIAVTVADDWQDKGIGIDLLKRLIEFAQLAGIKELYSIDSHANEKMKQLAKDLGFSKKTDPDDASQVIYKINIEG